MKEWLEKTPGVKMVTWNTRKVDQNKVGKTMSFFALFYKFAMSMIMIHTIHMNHMSHMNHRDHMTHMNHMIHMTLQRLVPSTVVETSAEGVSASAP